MAEQLCRCFSLSEMQSATGDFSDARVIGKGGFGKVYKGLIDNGSVTVAVKRLASNSNQGAREFAAEMETLSKFRHRNLVTLIGYCSEEEEMILVYEYMANGTLADHLYKLSRDSDEGGSYMSWNQRLKICIGAGRGLDYLHSGCSIIHRDVKSTNILLDDNFTPKVSDFGLAKTNILESHVSASVKGSFGYFDPSYFTTGRLTKASDTYAFGVVLLEVLSGRPPVDRRLDEDELCMTMWAQEKIRNGKANQIVALNLKGDISEGCLKTFVGVAKRCLDHEPKKRLTMTQAVAQLELALEQQERKGTTTPKLQFWPFWDRVIPSGKRSTRKDQNEEVEVDELPNATPAIEEEDAIGNKQSVDMQPISAPAMRADHIVNMLPISAPAMRADHIVNMLPIYVPAFPYAEIKDITDDFSSECTIPHGFRGGSAFYGVLKSGQDATIIEPYKEMQDHEFIAQISRISSLKHENVVQLLGYCLDGGLRFMVCECAPRGSLHDILHGQIDIKGFDMKPRLSLSWAQRIKIGVGVATGLCYIHDKALIHRIASSNVLLFDETAKITNPHLSNMCYREKAHLDEHRPLGFPPCFGYHPPEFEWNGHTQKGDVYSFGIILLEILTGHKVFDLICGGEHLVKWATPNLSEDKVQTIVDARLRGDYPPLAVAKVAEVAAKCLKEVAHRRPNMTTVVSDLQIASRRTQDYLVAQKLSRSRK